MKTFIKHLLIDYKIGIREQSIVLMNYLFPLIFYFFMGAVMGQVNPGYKEYMLPSMLLFAILTSTILIAPNFLSDAREKGVYRSYKIYGVSKISILSLLILSNLFSVLVVYSIIAITSHFFGATMPTNWFPLILATLIFWFDSISIAILIGILVKNSKHVVVFSQLIFLPSLLLGGIMVESNHLSPSLFNVSKILPSTHTMNIINDWAYGKDVPMNSTVSLPFLLLIGIIFMLLNFRLFRYDNNSTIKRSKSLLKSVTKV